LLKDKNVLITGATSGIGRAIAQKLLEKNANVACCGQSEEKIKSLIDEHYSFNSKKIYKAFDIVNENEILTFIEESSAAIGEIDILINCAGVNSERANVESISTQCQQR
jgi:NADP-dependent 3-hydroxy acid dehydrogenase YdfG